jgi:hypothetical protein
MVVWFVTLLNVTYYARHAFVEFFTALLIRFLFGQVQIFFTETSPVCVYCNKEFKNFNKRMYY